MNCSTIDSEDGMGWKKKVFCVVCMCVAFAFAFFGHLSNGSGERGMLVEI